MSAACCADGSAAGPAVGTQAQQPIADQSSTNDGNGPEGQAFWDETPLIESQATPENEPQGGDGAEQMPLQRSAEITSEGCSRRSGQKAGGAGHARECAKGAAKARKGWMQALEPQCARQGRGQQITRVLQPTKKTVQSLMRPAGLVTV